MITDIIVNPDDWKKECFIASKLNVLLDDEGNEVVGFPQVVPLLYKEEQISSNNTNLNNTKSEKMCYSTTVGNLCYLKIGLFGRGGVNNIFLWCGFFGKR